MPLTINAEKVIYELRKPITNLVSCFSYKYSGEKTSSALHMAMPFTTLLEKLMPQMFQLGFFVLFHFSLSYVARYVHLFYFSQYLIKRKGRVTLGHHNLKKQEPGT